MNLNLCPQRIMYNGLKVMQLRVQVDAGWRFYSIVNLTSKIYLQNESLDTCDTVLFLSFSLFLDSV